MSEFRLGFPYLIYLCIASMLVGVLAAPAFRDLPDNPAPSAGGMVGGMEMDGMEMEHPLREVAAASAPSVSMSVTADAMSGWNVALETENFTFAPLSAGGASVPNEGHAHLYVNGRKIARLYGAFHHIPALTPGQHEILVTLSSNDHAYFAVDGARIEARTLIMQTP